MNELFFWGMFVIGDLSKRPVFLKTLRTLQWLLVALRINPTLPNWPANSCRVLAPGATSALLLGPSLITPWVLSLKETSPGKWTPQMKLDKVEAPVLYFHVWQWNQNYFCGGAFQAAFPQDRSPAFLTAVSPAPRVLSAGGSGWVTARYLDRNCVPWLQVWSIPAEDMEIVLHVAT